MIYPRKEAKEYGTRAEIEGEYKPGETAVLIDDLATTGGSKFEVIDKLKLAGLQVQDVVVLIDRQSGAREALQQAGFRLHAVVYNHRTVGSLGADRPGPMPIELRPPAVSSPPAATGLTSPAFKEPLMQVKDYIQSAYDYAYWANRRYLAVAEGLPEKQAPPAARP